MIRNVKNAESALPMIIHRLKEATGPKRSVMGKAMKLAPGIAVGTIDNSIPYGCQIYVVKKGFI
jgi:hypothetical protein